MELKFSGAVSHFDFNLQLLMSTQFDSIPITHNHGIYGRAFRPSHALGLPSARSQSLRCILKFSLLKIEGVTHKWTRGVHSETICIVYSGRVVVALLYALGTSRRL
jgi:hypothetical protein